MDRELIKAEMLAGAETGQVFGFRCYCLTIPSHKCFFDTNHDVEDFEAIKNYFGLIDIADRDPNIIQANRVFDRFALCVSKTPLSKSCNLTFFTESPVEVATPIV
jgi:hypothetical protein